MELSAGQRVFFKRKALRALRGYWCRRWDDLTLRRLLSLSYEPRYHLASVHLDGLFVRLERMDFLWFHGLFNVGLHQPTGQFQEVPVPARLAGLGPRELVFPLGVLDGPAGGLSLWLQELCLIGGWERYGACSPGRPPLVPEPAPLPRWPSPGSPSRSPFADRLWVQVDRVSFREPLPLIRRVWTAGKVGFSVEKPRALPTLCLEGRALSGPLTDRPLVVPIREILWRALGRSREEPG